MKCSEQKIYRIKISLAVAWGWGGNRINSKWLEESYWLDKLILKLDYGDSCSTQQMH